MWLQVYDLIGITDTWWDKMWLRRTGWNSEEEESFYMSEQWECMELCRRMGKEPVRIRGQINGGDIVGKKKAEVHLELNLKEAKSSRKGFYRYRRTRGKCGPTAERDRRCGDKGHGEG